MAYHKEKNIILAKDMKKIQDIDPEEYYEKYGLPAPDDDEEEIDWSKVDPVPPGK